MLDLFNFLCYNIMVKNAGVAQWQSSGIVNRRLRVRIPSPAPSKNQTPSIWSFLL